MFSAVERVPGSWQFQPGDRFYVGDFNGDGKDEVAVFNGTDWIMEYLGLLADDGANGLRLIARYDNSMPNWDFTPGDRFYVADFNGDGKKDIFVFNGGNWAIPYVGMLRSTGAGFNLVRRYDANMPGWQMRPGDRHYVGDFTGHGREDLWVFNGTNWSIPYLGMLRSTGSALAMSKRYDANMPGWQMRPGDRHYVGDFTGDGKADLYVFNGTNWSIAYLGMLQSTGTALAMIRRYDGNAPGWQMRAHDTHWICGHQQRRQGRPVRLQPPGLGAGVPRDDDHERHRPRGGLARRLGGRVEPRLRRPLRAMRLRGRGWPPRPDRPQHRLARDDPRDAEPLAPADLPQVDSQLQLRPELVR